MTMNIPGTVQDAVDQYMELYQVSKQLEERMSTLRKIIEPFMREYEISAIRDRNRTGKVQLTVQERARMTARYTTYYAQELSKLLEPHVIQRCLVEVVDKDKVDALSKLGELPAEVSEYRTTSPTYSLTVRFEK
ncbi:hypothetical protein JZ785_26000 [Alicyclobacillus curvatus]|nr:hypothetical protein JZ785_26000 [Alicyclobacillus curvatus]